MGAVQNTWHGSEVIVLEDENDCICANKEECKCEKREKCTCKDDEDCKCFVKPVMDDALLRTDKMEKIAMGFSAAGLVTGIAGLASGGYTGDVASGAYVAMPVGFVIFAVAAVFCLAYRFYRCTPKCRL